MRRLSFLLLAALATRGFAQSGAREGVFFTLKTLQRSGRVPLATQTSPLEPTAFGGQTQGILPAPQNVPKRLELVRSGKTSRSGDVLTAEGGVELLFEGYRVLCQRARGNVVTKVFEFTGNVSVVGADAVVKGEQVVVDFDKKTFEAYEGDSEIRPNLIKGYARDSLFFRSARLSGGEKEFTGERCKVTTCNLKEPHFHLDANNAVVRPGRRVIFRGATLNVLGRRILRIPYLAVPLDDRAYRSLPDIGQSPDEGYYVKNRWSIPVRGDSAGTALVDLMSKRGVGLGGDYQYRTGKLDGRTRIYTVFGTIQTFSVNNEHQQSFKFGTFSLQNDFQQDNYLTAPGSTTYSTRAQFQLPIRKSDSTRIGFLQQGSRTDGFTNSSMNVSLADQRKFGSFLTTTDVNWQTSESAYGTTTSSRKQVDLRWKGTQDVRFANVSLDYQRQIPIGETQGFFGSSDRTPVLSLQTDSQRLFGPKRGEAFPFRSEFSLGEYFDTTSQSPIGRGNLDFNFQKSDRGKGRIGFDYNGQFRQGLYSDDTAQYVLGLGGTGRYKLGPDTSFNLRYNYLRPYGYSPLIIDRSGKNNYLTADLTVRPIRSLLVGAQTGFDINRLDTQDNAWQQVGIRTEWRPTGRFLLRGLTSYDTFQKAWSSVRLDTSLKSGPTFLSLGTRYDGIRHTWGNANLFVDNIQVGKIKASAVLAYNGYLKQFESQQYAITYNLHCAEAVLTVVDNSTGFRSGRTITLFVRIKALPFDTGFGAGTRGQPIGTGTGRDF
ncbi:MAG: hypothetical protein ACOYON_13195 [Fimbriimonas sp.]